MPRLGIAAEALRLSLGVAYQLGRQRLANSSVTNSSLEGVAQTVEVLLDAQFPTPRSAPPPRVLSVAVLRVPLPHLKHAHLTFSPELVHVVPKTQLQQPVGHWHNPLTIHCLATLLVRAIFNELEAGNGVNDLDVFEIEACQLVSPCPDVEG